MNTAKELDLLNDPLEGSNLTEASAGTGKTYAIAALFLRLVLEQHLAVDEILVVTFTQAATEELKDRIRNKLREAVQAVSLGGSEDAFLSRLVKRHRDSKAALRHLVEALRAFDQASICTIHGFCRRVLYENAFESGTLFDTDLVAYQEDLKAEIVHDFWRKHFYKASPFFVHYAIRNKVSPDGLWSLLGNKVTQPYLKVIPKGAPPDSSLQEKAFLQCFQEVREAWRAARSEVECILLNEKGLSRHKYEKANIPLWIHSMDEYVASEARSGVLFKGFDRFTSRGLKDAVKKGHRSPAHPFFELCEELSQKQEELERVFEQQLIALKAQLFDFMQYELNRRKEEKNLQSFDDLLQRVHCALMGERGEALAKAVRKRFKAALIDEFQDTDPVQYDIFKKLFGVEKSLLFLIGDPKQAIYGFRGADVFAYMDAARHVEFRNTLGENWRSEPGLIAAINGIFSHNDHPFIHDDIPFQAAVPATRKDAEVLSIDGKSEPPLHIWSLKTGKTKECGSVIGKMRARELISAAVAAEISRLLRLARDGQALLGERPLREGDMAVLVRRNADAHLVQEALAALDIPSVLYSAANLFDSNEALQLERLLAGITEPSQAQAVRAALATDMMGVKGEDLHALLEDEVAWEKWLLTFKQYHDLWNECGFIRMLRTLLLKQGVLTRLMSLPQGERRNTNLLHLSEVLHQASVEKKLGMAGLLKWFSEQRDPSAPRLEEHQLRLETDEAAVKVLTIHKSKGLEYPVVFCPFMWDGSRVRKANEPFTFHNPEDHLRLTLDLGSPRKDENRVFAEREQLAENLRLLYVALTRAKNRCYLVWGRFNEAESSAPAYLFHHPEGWEGNVVNAVEAKFVAMTEEEMLSDMEALQERAEGTISLCEMPMEEGITYSPPSNKSPKLSCRRFIGHIDHSWQISSFSSLISGQTRWTELPDHDPASSLESHDQRALEELEAPESPTGIFAFPKGARAGTFLHDLFEHLDFTSPKALFMEKLVAEKLQDYAYAGRWHETLCNMIRKVLFVPLDPGRKDFTLSRIGNKDRLNELEFYFPLQSISPDSLKGLFQKHQGHVPFAHFPEQMERLRFSPVRGLMKGFIDMVFQFENRFYLVDWKSNFLGPRLEDYDQQRLTAAMEEGFYVLQYHLYAVALHQYLRLRSPGYAYEKDFGGVLYIFLRGVDPDRGPDFGVYRDRPSGALINELSASLIDKRRIAPS